MRYLRELESTLSGAREIRESASSTVVQRRIRSLIEEVRANLTDARLTGESAAAVAEALQRLARVCLPYHAAGMEEVAAQTYATPQELRTDVDLVLALAAAPEEARQLLAMQTYVRRATTPAASDNVDLDELAIDRRLVLERLLLSVALHAPHQIEELTANFQVFRHRYERVYLEQHARYYEEVRALRSAIRGGGATLDTLALLNGIGALGAPIGRDLERRAEELLAALRLCERSESNLPQTGPRCPDCDLQLEATPPAPAVRAWQTDLEEALRAQQRRLSRAMVTRAVVERDRPAFDRFLRAVQAGDLAPLVEVMDENVASLIRELLQPTG